MHILKLALPLGGLLIAGQAMAHKALHVAPTPVAPARLAPAQTDTNPAALLDGIGGRGTQGMSATPGILPQEPPEKSAETSRHINRRH
jgi:hypothetical protein